MNLSTQQHDEQSLLLKLFDIIVLFPCLLISITKQQMLCSPLYYALKKTARISTQ